MSQTNILLESGTNELEIVEFFIEEEDASGRPYTGYYGVNVAKVVITSYSIHYTKLYEGSSHQVRGY